MIKRRSSVKRRAKVGIMSHDEGHFFSFASTEKPLSPSSRVASNHKPANGQKTGLAPSARARLRQLETFLNNCLNLANNMDSKQTAKLVELLANARGEAQRLRAEG